LDAPVELVAPSGPCNLTSFCRFSSLYGLKGVPEVRNIDARGERADEANKEGDVFVKEGPMSETNMASTILLGCNGPVLPGGASLAGTSSLLWSKSCDDANSLRCGQTVKEDVFIVGSTSSLCQYEL
jgi:hypothetical protein